MRIAVFGNYGVQNLGDDLMLMGLQRKYAQDQLIVFCGNPAQATLQFGLSAFPFFPGGLRSFCKWPVSASYRRELREATRALQSMDLILIGGGGILVDRHLKAVLLWWMQLRKISQAKIPYEFIGNSFELRRWWSRWLFQPFLKKARAISVRNSSSQQFLASLGITSLLADDLSALVPLEGHRTPRKLIALALCQWGIGESQLQSLRQFIRSKQEQGYEIIGLAFQLSGDDDREFFSKLDPGLTVKTSLAEILETFSSCEAVVAMRYHAALLAIRFQIPLVALSYQHKVRELMEDKGLGPFCIPIKSLEASVLDSLFQKAVEAREK